MLTHEENKLEILHHLTITQHLLFLLESIPKKNQSLLFEEIKKYAIIGATITDLMLLKKVALVDNRLEIINSEKTDFSYMNTLLAELQSEEEKKLLMEVIYNYRHEAEVIEEEILKELLEKELLIEKKGLIPFLFPTELRVKDPELAIISRESIQKALTKESKPEKEVLYVIAIMDAIYALQKFMDTKEEYEEKKKRLDELLEEEELAKKVYETITSQPEPEFPAYYIPPMYFMDGLTGLY